jgi:hypothetical protein
MNYRFGLEGLRSDKGKKFFIGNSGSFWDSLFYKCPRYHRFFKENSEFNDRISSLKTVSKKILVEYYKFHLKNKDKNFVFEKKTYHCSLNSKFKEKPQKNKFFFGEIEDFITQHTCSDRNI